MYKRKGHSSPGDLRVVHASNLLQINLQVWNFRESDIYRTHKSEERAKGGEERGVTAKKCSGRGRDKVC